MQIRRQKKHDTERWRIRLSAHKFRNELGKISYDGNLPKPIFSEEIMEWLLTTIEEDNFDTYCGGANYNTVFIRFANKDDLLLFRMMWL